MRRLIWLAALALSCAEPYYADAPDVDLPVPAEVELEGRRKAYIEGTERYHGDPRHVAHIAMDYHLQAPWRGKPYRPSDYEFTERDPEHRDWGSYVVRGAYDSAGRYYRARVKVARHREIWYAVQVSHFLKVDFPDEHDHNTPPDVHK